MKNEEEKADDDARGKITFFKEKNKRWKERKLIRLTLRLIYGVIVKQKEQESKKLVEYNNNFSYFNFRLVRCGFVL
jgi:hypothetical protein